MGKEWCVVMVCGTTGRGADAMSVLICGAGCGLIVRIDHVGRLSERIDRNRPHILRTCGPARGRRERDAWERRVGCARPNGKWPTRGGSCGKAPTTSMAAGLCSAVLRASDAATASSCARFRASRYCFCWNVYLCRGQKSDEPSRRASLVQPGCSHLGGSMMPWPGAV